MIMLNDFILQKNALEADIRREKYFKMALKKTKSKHFTENKLLND